MKAALTRVTTVEDPDPNKDNGYGYGLGLSKTRGLKEVAHGGGLAGFHCNLLRIPDQHFTVVVLANSMPNVPGLGAGTISTMISQLYLADKMQQRVTPKIDSSISPSSYDDYVGRYDYGAAVMTISRQDDHLMAQLAGQEAFEIFPKAKDVFFWKAVEAEVTFQRDETGKVIRALHTQGGQTITAPRLEETAAIKVDSKSLDDFVGKYDYGRGVTLTVTREGNQLFAQATNQPKFEIFAKSQDEFFWKVVKAEVKFVRDSSGKVVKAVHSQGGMAIEAPRVE